MKKGLWIVIGVVVIIVAIIATFSGRYNSLVSMEENVDGRWAQVENQLKRRADLIPNLVNTVQGYAEHEENVLTQITEARSSFNNANTPAEYSEANAEFESALSSLYVVVENYPDLKANENFKELQYELSGTENRIAAERMRYNEAVQEFNTTVKRFPTNMIAGLFGFEQREYFEIDEADSEVPEVNF